MAFNRDEHQHLRYNPLRAEWLLVSPHRALRPWAGQVEPIADEAAATPPHDPTNPLCPGAERASGRVTPHYRSTYVFDNDFPALLEDGPEPPPDGGDDALFRTRAARGACRVICYHPRSDVYFTEMTVEEVGAVVDEWVRQSEELGKKYKWVQIFENRGAMMGCSNPHPHCQIWASSFIPNEPRIKDANLKEYYAQHGTPMLMDYVAKELEKKERIVYENDDWLVVVPYWAVWPFETMVLPKRQVQRMRHLPPAQRTTLAVTLRALVAKYDNVFACRFPYSMGWHGALDGDLCDVAQPHWTFHGMFLPPLLRSAAVRKFMVGYELLAQAQRDLTPERAAAVLRGQPEVRVVRT